MKTTTTNLFASATKVKETAKKTDKKVINAPELGNKIQRFAELKQLIDSATGELKMIEGDIKGIGKKLFMSEYKQQRSTPDNFKIQDETGNSCMFICMDKYTIVDETKASILANFEGLLAENVVYKFNADLVEKYGAVLSELILNCSDIDDLDKGNLISGEKTFSVAKGSIDRLMQYANPEQVYELINPIVALKK
jgi:hypothetical protein|tara:strand:+ start:1339 stop:1923 length:585 start_codon:yes stop_codon:yes gene_type:complete